MPQTESVYTPCLRCKDEFDKERVSHCRTVLRYQRENFSQRGDIAALELQLKSALEIVFDADRRYAEMQHSLQKIIDSERINKMFKCTPL